MGIFGLSADPGTQYLPPFRTFLVFFSVFLKEHSPDYYTLFFTQSETEVLSLPDLWLIT